MRKVSGIFCLFLTSGFATLSIGGCDKTPEKPTVATPATNNQGPAAPDSRREPARTVSSSTSAATSTSSLPSLPPAKPPETAQPTDKKIEKPTAAQTAAIKALKELGVEVQLSETEYQKSKLQFTYTFEEKNRDAVARQLPALKGLSLPEVSTFSKLSDAILLGLSQLTNVQEFNAGDGSDLTDAGIAEFGKLSNLREFRLSDAKISSQAWQKALPSLKDLESLTLEKSNLQNDLFSVISSLSNLKTLEVAGNPKLTNDILKEISKLKKLEKLDLAETSVTDAGFVHLADLSKLRSLRVAGPELSDDGFRYLVGMASTGKFPSLMFGECVNVTGTGLKAFSGKQLYALMFDHVGVTDAGLAEIKNIRAQELHLPDYGLGYSIGDQKFWSDPHPERLTDAGLKHVGEMKTLFSLSISGGGVTDAGLEHLSGLENLKAIYFGFCPKVTGTGFNHLAKIKLERLQLSGTKVKPSHLSDLVKGGSLKQVTFNSLFATEAEIEAFKKANPKIDVSTRAVGGLGD